MKDSRKLEAAKYLFNNRLNKSSIKRLPQNLCPKNLQESYAIQDELKILYLSLSNNICIGKKVGCTNKIAQKQVGIYEPFYGNLFSKYSNVNKCKLRSSKFCLPFAEPEISFRIKDDININLAPFRKKDIYFLFDKILPSIELVDFRFGNNISKIGINNLIISNGASEYWIKSQNSFSLDSVNLNDLEVKLYSNDKLKEKGNTNMVLENPINSALWLLNKLSKQGEPMLKGQYISTGTCTKALKLNKDSNIRADFGTLGSIEFNYI